MTKEFGTRDDLKRYYKIIKFEDMYNLMRCYQDGTFCETMESIFASKDVEEVKDKRDEVFAREEKFINWLRGKESE